MVFLDAFSPAWGAAQCPRQCGSAGTQVVPDGPTVRALLDPSPVPGVTARRGMCLIYCVVWFWCQLFVARVVAEVAGKLT